MILAVSAAMLVLVPWSQLSPTEKESVLALKVSARQVAYAGTVESAVAQCAGEEAGDIVGLAVVADATVAGFLLLKRGTRVPPWASPDSIVVNALRIDERFQGKGYGTRALLALPDWVSRNWHATRSIALSVDEENVAAISSYKKAGWVDHGTRVEGRVGWVRHMSRAV